MQVDIDEVNKIAHGLKARLDNLARMNEAALKRPVCHLLHYMQLTAELLGAQNAYQSVALCVAHIRDFTGCKWKVITLVFSAECCLDRFRG